MPRQFNKNEDNMKDKVFVLGILKDIKEGIDNRYNMHQWNILAKKGGLLEKIDAAIDLDLNVEITSLITTIRKYVELEYSLKQWTKNVLTNNIDLMINKEIEHLEKEIKG